MFLYINGARKLDGEIAVWSAKNSILPIIACCLMTKKGVLIKNCPPLNDVKAMADIITSIGGRVELYPSSLYIDCAAVHSVKVEDRLTRPIRSSIFILGPLLSRFKRAEISFPGGCEIGSRPIDIHLDTLKELGTKIHIENGIIDCDGSELGGGIINLRFPSVGATENLMMAAVLTKGVTVINNAAREPEIVDLAMFINMLGGKISGAGSGKIIIEGVNELNGGEYTPIPDRIAIGTFLAACGACSGKICLNNVSYAHVYSIIDKLHKAGCRFNYKKNSLTMIMEKRLNAIENTITMPYPGFPTDMQPQLAAALSTANGTSIITENLFDNRFKYVHQLKKLGAKITLEDNRAIIEGATFLKGANVDAQDLRGGAALIIAGLCARGTTKISGLEHIERGYYKIEDDLLNLNADIVKKV